MNNGSAAYDNDKDGKDQSVGGCELKFRNKDYETLIAIRWGLKMPSRFSSSDQ